ncbi:MAG: YheT family hydrolase [Adhaeribacter sp.]
MPVIPSAYHRPPYYLFNRHLQTIVPSLFRRVSHLPYRRERILLADGDFLDLDWSQVQGQALSIISHGLEGSSDRPYIRGMVRALNRAGIDALAWNYRSCSGESNKALRSYHMGATDDLQQVVAHALQQPYQTIYLVGFSAGGNITLKYLGEDPDSLPRQVKKAAVFSVPCDLQGCSDTLSRPENRIYLRRFLKSLKKKLELKARDYPGDLDLKGYELLQSFPAFDDRYTAPLHGFKDARDYYTRCSSRQFLAAIRIPTLLVNAENDPFLSPDCFPVSEAETNPNLYLEMPRSGGHVGFTQSFWADEYYSETRAVAFFAAPDENKT